MTSNMPRLFELHEPVTLFTAEDYPRSNQDLQRMGLSGGRNAEIRAITIAAFRIAQNNTQLSQRPMQAELLEFLLARGSSAVPHWRGKSRLEPIGQGYQLTPLGIAECQNTLLGLSGNYSTTEAKVQDWVVRMLRGDRAAPVERAFAISSWS